MSYARCLKPSIKRALKYIIDNYAEMTARPSWNLLASRKSYLRDARAKHRAAFRLRTWGVAEVGGNLKEIMACKTMRQHLLNDLPW